MESRRFNRTSKFTLVADLLLKAGYCGKQKIYVTSCDAALKSAKDGKSIVDELQRCLEEKLMATDNQLLPITIESDCYDKSIFIDNSGVIEMWVIGLETKTKLVSYFNQTPFISKHNLYFKLNIKKYNKNNNLSNEFKKRLIRYFGG